MDEYACWYNCIKTKLLCGMEVDNMFVWTYYCLYTCMLAEQLACNKCQLYNQLNNMPINLN